MLHPFFGLSWFRKIDKELGTTDRASAAKLIFEHAYESYRRTHEASSEPTAPKAPQRSRPGTMNSFLDDVCMADIDDDEGVETVVSELERWWSAFKTYGRGEPNAPLAWWKVGAVFKTPSATIDHLT